tara:strand:- start:2776 stop:3831 length:1056 start_codon:yes stop_codon:yes gene_type:complete
MDTYLIEFDPKKNKGVYGISLVNDPAISEFFVQMSKDYEVKLTEFDKSKRLFMSPVLIPDYVVPRVDENGNAFNIVFSKEVIRLAQQEFQKNSFQNESTLEHNINIKLDGVTFVETWVKDDAVYDKSLMKGFDLPLGTWFTIFRVDDDIIMSKIESGEIKGVSIDGGFHLNNNVILKKSMDIEMVLNAIKDGFSSLKQKSVKLSSETTIDEVKVYFDGDVLVMDALVFSDEAMSVPLENGTYEFEKMNVTVLDGKVTEVADKVDAEKVDAEKVDAEKVALADQDLEAKIGEIMQVHAGEIAKEVAKQLADFETKMSSQAEIVRLAKAKPNHIEVEPKNFKERLLIEMKKQN